MLKRTKLAAWVGVAALVAATLAWQSKAHTTPTRHLHQDTLPNKDRAQTEETIINGDLDKALEDVKKAQENLDRQLEKGGFKKIQKDLLRAQAQLNAKDIHAEIARAMKEMELQKINMEDELKSVDMQKIQEQTQEALEKINWDDMKRQLQKAHAEVKNNIDYKEMERMMHASMEQTKKAMAQLKTSDLKKMQQALEQAQEGLATNEGRMQEEIQKAKRSINDNLLKDLSKELLKANEGIRKASEELQHYKEMISEMEKDGLLKQDGTYNIKYKHGELYIDDVKQPVNVTDKYKHYFKHENVQLKKNKDENGDGKTIDL